MITTPTLTSLLKSACNYSKEQTTKLILADYYEENGEQDRADFWRWCYEHKIYPCNSNDYSNRNYRFWFNNKNVKPSDGIPSQTYTLNTKLFLLLKNSLPELYYPGDVAYYKDRESAFEDLFLAFVALGEN